MDNAYLTNPVNKWEIPWFLLGGGITEAFQYDTFESFNKKLWELLVALTSRRKQSNVENIQLLETMDRIVLMVRGCHYFLHHKKRLKFTDDWIDIDWVKNPYRCMKKYRSNDDLTHNYHLAHFKERFTQLSRQEAQNFVLAFVDFFDKMDLSSWLNLLEDWKSCVEDEKNLLEEAVDYAPLSTYEQLLKLHEACRVGIHWAQCSYPPPNRHLIDAYLLSDYVNGYRSASPFEMIGDVFYEKSYADIRQSILSLYSLSPNERKSYPIPTHGLRCTLRWLQETGWLFLQTDYFPEDWLDPDRIDFLRCPIPQDQLDYWNAKSLSDKEQKNLRKTLSKLYYGIDVRQDIYQVEDRIIGHYHQDSTARMDDDDLATRNRLLKTLDILTLIVLDLGKRTTRTDGVFYPSAVCK